MKRQTQATRRQFLTQAAAASAAALSIPCIVPSSALGRDEAVAPSERIVMGCIGTGGRGGGNMRTFMSYKEVRVVAVCDVDAGHRNGAKNAVNQHYGNQDCAAYEDFRELTARKDLDAVSIATPDHWHGLTSIGAANAGMDVYCEKPLANSVAEGRAMADAVKRNKRILQCGSHERSNSNCRYACELVRNGRIGKLRTVRINLPCSDGHHKQAQATKTVPPAQPVPEGFDYDFWLGHTPKAPYTPQRCHFWWRFILSYGGGEMTDRGAHVIDIGQLGAGTDDTGPAEIEAKGVQTEGSLYDAWWDYEFVNTFSGGLKMIGSHQGPRGLKFEGTDGWIFVGIHGGRLEASKPELLKEKIGDDEIQLGRSPGHHRNFIECVINRKEPFATAEIGHRTATLCHLNNIAMAVGRKLKWDPEKEQVIGDEEANRMLAPVMRPPWKL